MDESTEDESSMLSAAWHADRSVKEEGFCSELQEDEEGYMGTSGT